ncbi:MAG: carbamoyltransferase HypF [Promethearchaeota archaeon]|jgi:hydrogenase maturation protein HypF
MKLNTIEIEITGIVQGVGFRPFLFNLARDFNFKGKILNRGNAGVKLVIQGDLRRIQAFLDEIWMKKPKISYIEEIKTKKVESNIVFTSLQIEKSEQGRGISLTLPPDIAMCEDCINDMLNSKLLKYFNYPFVACAVCGPRFTTVTELPYDRERSTMINFPFCEQAEPESCIAEYSDFSNRRFHAQTFACSVCGPHYKLYSKNREIINEGSIDAVLQETAKRINAGDIVAIKGIGGVHAVCLCDNDVILKLRKRKGERKYKPFAVMVSDLDVIDEAFKISSKERDLLISFRRPIVLLNRTSLASNSIIPYQVAPGLHNVGVMLPYSGIHHLLFEKIGKKPLIYTSGNKSYIPMAIENVQIFEQLQDLADMFLLHNRRIYQRADDSVLRVHKNKIKLIRRSRGFVPEYLPLPFNVGIPGAIATGPLLATTGAILRGNRIFPTQHIGNVSHLETYEFLKDALFHMKNLLQIKDSEIEFIACDAHPEFITTKLAGELGNQYNCEIHKIQHHYAHILSLMAENNVGIEERVIGIALDGVGYGNDGNIWGGELILSSYNEYERLGHLENQPMIGGDRCTKYPARMIASIILNALDLKDAITILKKLKIEDDLEYKEAEVQTIISQFEKARSIFPTPTIPLTSSTGRIFDSISYLLGASKIKTYRGEPAMRLESMAMKGNPNNVELNVDFTRKSGMYEINTTNIVMDIVSLLETGKFKKADIAACFQIELANTLAEVSIKLAKENKIEKIGLTGGVAYNYTFSNTIKEKVLQSNLLFLEHNKSPPGDAGISIGQLIGGLFKHSKLN